MAGAGAMGGLAGCGGGGGDGGGDGGDGGDTPMQEAVTIRLWSGTGAENTALTDHFNDSLDDYESMKGNVEVDFQPVPFSEIVNQLNAAVNANNQPEVAQSGGAGIPFFLNEVGIDHGPYIEETAGLPDNWAAFNIESAQYRGSWWAGGTEGANNTMLTLRPQIFKDHGFDDPEALSTWTDITRAFETIKSESPNVFPYEESGVWNDLESYWGQAQTSHTNGDDPWLRGTPPNFDILVGQGGSTDGLIRACIDRARTFSSPSSSQRTDEEMPALMLTDRVGANTTGFGNPQRWRAQDENVEFGWDGDVWQGPIPRVDANYGAEFGYPELEGVEGEHGGSTSGLQSQYQILDSDLNDQAWELLNYLINDENHIVPIIGEYYGNVAGYVPHNEIVRDTYDLVQIQTAMIETIDTYGPQCKTTGASWDISGTDAVRFDALNRNISEGIAGQISADQAIADARSDIEDVLAQES